MNITLAEKPAAIRQSGAARQALAARAAPRLAEMEPLLSCLIRKRVGFANLDAQAAITEVIEGLADPGSRVESVRQAGFHGLCEVRVNGKLPYICSDPPACPLGWLADRLAQTTVHGAAQ